MQKEFYFLSPVEVVKVTSQNLEEVAEWCGGKVAQTESRRVPGRMDSYVWVPTPKGSSISWAFPGMFITKRLVVTVKNELKATWSVFRRDYFEKNYFNTPADAVNKTWELEDRSPKAKTEVTPSEPLVAPGFTTVEAELDAESRERIEQVNAEILKGHVPDFVREVAKKATGQKAQPQASLIHEELVEAGAGDAPYVTVVEKAPPAETIEAYVHEHAVNESCDLNPFIEGIHVYEDKAVSVDSEGIVTDIDMPAAVAEIKPS